MLISPPRAEELLQKLAPLRVVTVEQVPQGAAGLGDELFFAQPGAGAVVDADLPANQPGGGDLDPTAPRTTAGRDRGQRRTVLGHLGAVRTSAARDRLANLLTQRRERAALVVDPGAGRQLGQLVAEIRFAV